MMLPAPLGNTIVWLSLRPTFEGSAYLGDDLRKQHDTKANEKGDY